MLKFCVFLHDFLTRPLRRDDRGVTSVEYGLMVALIAVVISVTVALLGKNLSALFNNVAGTVNPPGN
ncbi:MAG: Flp family type IVb pilin [Streptosporangiaceae bacterium]